MLDLDIPKPLEAEIYYTICSAIEWNSKTMCNYIKLENKLGNHIWDQPVNLSIFGVTVVDIYNAAKNIYGI